MKRLVAKFVQHICEESTARVQVKDYGGLRIVLSLLRLTDSVTVLHVIGAVELLGRTCLDEIRILGGIPLLLALITPNRCIVDTKHGALLQDAAGDDLWGVPAKIIFDVIY